MKVQKAVLPAAGLGTRFLPATKAVPKELLPIVDQPALQWVVEELVASGINEIIFVLSPGKESISRHFQPDPKMDEELRGKKKLDRMERIHRLLDRAKFSVAIQEEAKGLGHAVYCARKEVGDEPFAVALPDDLVRSSRPCLEQILDVARNTGVSSVAVEKVPMDQVSSYGMIESKDSSSDINPGQSLEVEGIIEKPAREDTPSQWAIIGRYILDPDVFSALESTKPGALGEIQLTDALVTLAKSKGLRAAPFEGKRMDAGQPAGYIKANLLYAFENPDLKASLVPFMKELLDA